MDIIQLFQDYNVPYYTEGYKYCRPGWINVDCPFCVANHPGPHMGYELSSDHFHCWSCGWKPIDQTISKLINVDIHSVEKILKQYNYSTKRIEEIAVKVKTKVFKLPSNTMPLQKNHRQYLESRNFDPDKLTKLWGLVGTGPVSKLDHIDYKHRIVIPFFWNDEIVSFDSRDITKKTDIRYKACPKERETIPHKEILYGKQSAWGETGICVEGPTDVWRFGENSFAVSGIAYIPKQVRLMAKLFSRIAVCFDGGEPQAIKKANSLVADLKFRGVDAFRVDIIGDPGAMDQNEADYLVEQLIH